MRTHESRGRVAAGAAVLLGVLAIVALGLVSRAARPKREPCPDGRYLVQEAPLLAGVATTPAAGITIAEGQITLDGACPAAPVKQKAKRRGTTVRGLWPLCDGVEGAVRLKGRIEPTCQTFSGRVTARKERAKQTFTAIRSTCGDGVLDPAAGEECDADLGCTPPAACSGACICAAPATTTTTSIASSSSTSSTIGGSTTTSTTLPAVPGPDPATTAPALDPTATTSFATATSFLFAGPNPVQFNVDPDALEPERVAVVRGIVLDAEGLPLSAALVRVLGHPGFGQTLSRTDGRFDLVVNGGGPLTLQYAKDGFLSAQRQVAVPWQDYVEAPEVRLCPLDAQATVVDLGAATEITVARGSEKTDADGTRQATLLVEPGTAAEMIMPDGSTQALGEITVRATEFTVGDAGPEMMPAVLPAQSGYTYAVEFSVDEAMAEGAAMVKFDRPIPTYVENFTGFPAGTPVPAGYYDRVKGTWIAAPDGRVIAVVGVTGGAADLDVSGDGLADTGAALADLGIDDAEREKLATLYTPGQSLWRVPVDHFTPWDYNWPAGPPDDAEDPEDSGAGASSDDEPIDGSCEASGSVIECENQVLGEQVELAGTPYALSYRSDRVPGRLDSLDVRLSGPAVPASLMRIGVRATVAGQTTEQTFAPAPDQRVVLTWNGSDAYGRPVQGGQRVTGSIDYTYPAVFRAPSEFGQSFARVGGAQITGNRTASTITVSMPFSAVLREGITDARGLGLGGWTLDVHHFYDPVTQVLHLGSGERRRAESVARVIDRLAMPSFPNDAVGGFAIGPDGALYVSHTGALSGVRRVTRDGAVTIFAGGGPTNPTPPPPYGEGGPAVGASVFGPGDLVFGSDGSLYIMEASRVILHVGLDGIIRRVAGRERFSNLGDPCPGTPVPDGAVATETDLCMQSIAVGPDGSIYFIERSAVRDHVVRRIGSDGLITTAAGTGQSCFGGGCGDGGPAVAAAFGTFQPFEMVVGPDGSLYLNDALTIRRVTPDGIIARFAGAGPQGFFGDGLPALDANFCGGIRSMTFGPDGAFFLIDSSNKRVRRIAPDGIVSTVVGSGPACDFNSNTSPLTQSGDGGPALQAGFGNLGRIAVAPDGDLFVQAFVTGTGGIVRRVGKPLPAFSTADILIASEDGRSLYAFDPGGRHLATIDALTGAVRREFGYDAEGRLATVTERTGGTDNVTTIERDAAGNPTGIVGPFGKRTTLTTDANGFLSSITNPAGETTGLASTASGLLTGFTAPGNRTSTFTYDAAGRLVRHEDAASGSQDLVRSGEPEAFTVTRTTALGRTTAHQVESLPNRVRRRTVTQPDGTEGLVVETLDAGTRDTTAPDGAEATIVTGGDPRFGIEAPVATSVSLRLPGGIEALTTNARTASLADTFDPLSLVTLGETTSVAGNTWATTYTAATRTFVTTSPLGRTRTLVLDALGRPVSLEASGGIATVAAYDARGRLATLTTGSAPDARVFTFAYDAQGLPASFTDPLGRTVGMERDAAGRLTRKTLPGGDVIDFTFDAAGDFVGLTPPGRPAHAFAYGPRGEITSITPPLVPGTGPTTFAYDDDGDLVSVTRPDETVTFGYDAAGRLSTLDLDVAGGAQGSYALAYDGATGLVSSVSGPGGTTLDYTYDGGIVTAVAWGGPVVGDVAIALDARLAVVTESVNGGSTVAFTHDEDDRLVAAGDLAITRDPATGLPATTTLGVVSDTWTHDAFGELVDYEATANGSPLYAESFERDGLGRIVRKVETIAGDTDTIEYAYDAKGQLISVVRDGSQSESYTYDPNGNRIAATVGGTSVTATYDDQDRLLTYGTATFTHTPSGRLAARTAPGGATAYEYDAAGTLLAVTLPGGTEVVYVLDPGFRRIARGVDGVATARFLWSGDRPLAQLDAGGALVARFVYAGGLAPAYVVRDGAAHRLVTDHAGSVRLVVNAVTGAVVQRLDYDAFGRVTLDTNPGFQPFGFGGGLYDAATGLVRFGARDYDATTGRWTAKDPIGFAGLDTNLYRYAGNDPVNLADPSGLGAGEIVAGIVSGLVDVAMFPAAFNHAAAELNAALTEAVTGIPQPVPPDPNPVVGIMEAVNDLADLFDAEPLVDTGSTAFTLSRLCASIVPTLGAGAAGGAARGGAGAASRGIRPAMQSAQKAIASTSDDAYRPLVSGQNARAERLAAENARRIAKEEAKRAAEQAKERGRLELVRPDGGGAGTRGINKPAGGLGTGR